MTRQGSTRCHAAFRQRISFTGRSTLDLHVPTTSMLSRVGRNWRQTACNKAGERLCRTNRPRLHPVQLHCRSTRRPTESSRDVRVCDRTPAPSSCVSHCNALTMLMQPGIHSPWSRSGICRTCCNNTSADAACRRGMIICTSQTLLHATRRVWSHEISSLAHSGASCSRAAKVLSPGLHDSSIDGLPSLFDNVSIASGGSIRVLSP